MQDPLPLLVSWLREDARRPPQGYRQGYRFEEISAQEWQALLAAADAHRVSPLLYARLRADGVLDRLPAEVELALERAYVVSRTRHALRWQALEHALSALAAQGIEVILLKGAALIATLYDEPALRPMDDLDILVSPAQFRAAVACLCERGYRPDHAEPFQGANEMISHHLALTGTVPVKHALELHHALLDLPAALGAAIPVPELLERAEALTVGAAPARVLCLPDQLLHLAAHLALQNPADERLIWYCDLDRLVRREADRLPWDEVLARAERYRMTLALQRVLHRLVALLDTPVPAEVLAQAAALPVDPAQRLRYGSAPSRSRSRLVDGLQKMAGAGSQGAGLRMAWRLLFPDRAYMRATYGDNGPLRLIASYPARWAAVLREATTRNPHRGR